MSEEVYLVNLETGGNQAYIFATNKLRNIVGASELLYRVGTSYVERAIKAATGREFRTADIMGEPPIESTSDRGFEVIIATSGKALLLFRDKAAAECFIRAWSRIVVSEAPGLDAVAVCSSTELDLSLSLRDKSEHSYLRVFRETERLMTIQRMRMGTPQVRFQRLPIVAECQYSGLPAVDIDSKAHVPVSASSRAQREASRDPAIRARMGELFPTQEGSKKCLDGLDSLEEQDWLAVVHADGNGLGQFFIDFDKHVQARVGDGREATGRDYINDYRSFSSALDRISQEAFKHGVKERWGEKAPKIVPVVVGGDDLTAVMDGGESLKFTQCFMREFCERTRTDEVTESLLKKSGLVRFGMCAGISIAKHHFPFSQSYHLAEALLKSAKNVKEQYGKESIALDFHILYDSTFTSLGDIRSRLTLSEEERKIFLTAKPYVLERGTDGSKPDEVWQRVHDFSAFERARKAMQILPSSQSHGVREALFSELTETQEREWEFLLHTYEGDNQQGLAAAWEKAQGDRRLYITVTQGDEDGAVAEEWKYTYFLDALEAMKFLGEQNQEQRGDTGK